MSCDLRVLKRFTPVTQGEKTHFPKKNQGFCRLPGSGNFLPQGSSRHKSGRNERGGADRPRPRTASQVLSHRPSETPSTKEVPNLKTPNRKNRCLDKQGAGRPLSLELGVWNLEFVAWALGFSKIARRPVAARSEGLT